MVKLLVDCVYCNFDALFFNDLGLAIATYCPCQDRNFGTTMTVPGYADNLKESRGLWRADGLAILLSVLAAQVSNRAGGAIGLKPAMQRDIRGLQNETRALPRVADCATRARRAKSMLEIVTAIGRNWKMDAGGSMVGGCSFQNQPAPHLYLRLRR